MPNKRLHAQEVPANVQLSSIFIGLMQKIISMVYATKYSALLKLKHK